ncbi:hypothetical protein SELMODRAFT_424701 [Selaginella moellendorffii]|uniref:Cytidyltransferase-like domain-containing protein n=1 Tax=Selaginella moellendorffii TaxID=88036 RepID=D8SQS6_SELML|nr:hypothetical protein SELMODRAFT_424701 [Selaginella moellendorffii]
MASIASVALAPPMSSSSRPSARFWILILKILKKTIPRPLPFAKGFVKSLRCRHSGALTTGSPKRGDHRCHISARTHSSLWRYDLTLYKGYRDCFGEDCLSSQLLIKAMADVCEIGNTVSGELRSPEEEIQDSRLNYTKDEELEQLIHGNVCMVHYPGEGSKDCRTSRRVVLSGDFNPLHEGHLTLMSTACT